MGRPRGFDTGAVLLAARAAFVRGGYAGTSVDDLLRETGLQRASLYSAFGSKRGLFVQALRAAPADGDPDLLLVALMDLAGEDDEVRGVVAERLGDLDATALGERVLLRGGLHEAREDR